MSITSSSNHTLWTTLFQPKGVASIVHAILDVIPLVEFLQDRFTFPDCLADYASLFHKQKNKHNCFYTDRNTPRPHESLTHWLGWQITPTTVRELKMCVHLSAQKSEFGIQKTKYGREFIMYKHADCMKVECPKVIGCLYLLQEATAAIRAAWICESRKFWYFSMHSEEWLRTFTKNIRCV